MLLKSLLSTKTKKHVAIRWNVIRNTRVFWKSCVFEESFGADGLNETIAAGIFFILIMDNNTENKIKRVKLNNCSRNPPTPWLSLLNFTSRQVLIFNDFVSF